MRPAHLQADRRAHENLAAYLTMMGRLLDWVENSRPAVFWPVAALVALAGGTVIETIIWIAFGLSRIP